MPFSQAQWCIVAFGATGLGIAALNYLACFSKKTKRGNGARDTIYVGTRKSPLAMAQTEYVIGKLQKLFPHIKFVIKAQESKGDKILDKPLVQIGDKGLFTAELEEGMHNHEIDLAVHSCKDLQTTLPPGLSIGAFLERHPREDVFIVNQRLRDTVKKVDDLPAGSVIGTSSLRRKAMLAHKHPTLVFKDIRGNIGTRLKKLDDPANQMDGTILAHAGLVRMDDAATYSSRITQVLAEEDYMYAVAQGILAVECRSNDDWLIDNVLSKINHTHTQHEAEAERALLRGLEGGCHVPLATRCIMSDDKTEMKLEGSVLSLDGKTCVTESVSGKSSCATAVGHQLAELLKSKGAKELLSELHSQKH